MVSCCRPLVYDDPETGATDHDAHSTTATAMHRHIRKATTADIPALMKIRAAVRENRLNTPPLVPAGAYQEFITRSSIWLWDADGHIRGFAAGDPSDGSVWALFVDPASEGNGVARALLPYVLDDLRNAGWKEATLSTQPNTRAEAFYRRQGWVPGGLNAVGDREFSLRLGT